MKKHAFEKLSIAKATSHFGGSKKELGKALGITHSAVSQWGEFVPDSRVCEVLWLMGSLPAGPLANLTERKFQTAL